MNAVENLPAVTSFTLSTKEETEVMKLAAVGFMPKDIAVAMEWSPERRISFRILADIPGSDVAMLIAAGKAQGRARPQMKLQEAAAAGNVEAIKALQHLQATNRFNELLTNMDDDEL